ncbi:hypothetical protein [Citrobacter sp.]|uniref:hypothetical protein n=1 Tax=Citrobacter sp. TaxID=1896336 RepID=UPI002FC5C88A
MANTTLKATHSFVSKLHNEGYYSFGVVANEQGAWLTCNDQNGNASRFLLGQATKTKTVYQLKTSYQRQVNKTLFIR